MVFNAPHVIVSFRAAVDGEKFDPGCGVECQRQIDGPANIRDSPNGKVIGSYSNKFLVLLEGEKDDWFYVRGYFERTCETGWTHQKNLKKVSKMKDQKIK